MSLGKVSCRRSLSIVLSLSSLYAFESFRSIRSLFALVPFYTYVLSTVLYSPPPLRWLLFPFRARMMYVASICFPLVTGFSCGGLGFRCFSLALGSDVDGSPLSRRSIKKKRNRHYAVAVPPERELIRFPLALSTSSLRPGLSADPCGGASTLQRRTCSAIHVGTDSDRDNAPVTPTTGSVQYRHPNSKFTHVWALRRHARRADLNDTTPPT
jgi:hypothetical protein